MFPRLTELTPMVLWRDIRTHLSDHQVRPGLPYGRTQKLLYAAVIYLAAPLMLLTGLTMSPAVTAAWPVLLDLFGGSWVLDDFGMLDDLGLANAQC